MLFVAQARNSESTGSHQGVVVEVSRHHRCDRRQLLRLLLRAQSLGVMPISLAELTKGLLQHRLLFEDHLRHRRHLLISVSSGQPVQVSNLHRLARLRLRLLNRQPDLQLHLGQNLHHQLRLHLDQNQGQRPQLSRRSLDRRQLPLRSLRFQFSRA